MTNGAAGNDDVDHPIAVISNVAIVGGGLAGLSTAYHLLECSRGNKMMTGKGVVLGGNRRRDNALNITIFDRSDVGMGGASSVAGG